MPPKKPQDLRDIIGGAVKVAKGAKKVIDKTEKIVLSIGNPKNKGKVIKGTGEALFATKEIGKIAQGKGTKKDYANVAGMLASWAVPATKLSKAGKLIKVGKGITRTSKVATKVGRGGAKIGTTAAVWGGADYAANKATMATLNKIKPNTKPRVTATVKPKIKPKTKPKGK